jgi:hypothetical protein
MRHRLHIALAAALFVVGLIPSVGSADPHDTRIVGVFASSECAAQTCDPSSDPKVASGAIIAGELQIFVSAEADVGLEWVRLEAQVPGDPRFYCLEFWNAQHATKLSQARRWNTIAWTDPSDQCTPETCSSCIETSPHKHGAVSENVVHTLRVVAHEQVSGKEQMSPTFKVKLQNAPVAASWSAQPAASSTADGANVGLQWARNDEKDIVEYRYVRTSPGGKRVAFAVSSTKPETQGCRRIGAVIYRCIDKITAGAPSGRYSYAIAAVRRAFSGAPCEVSTGRCIVGPLGEASTVNVTVAAAGGPTSTATVAPGTSQTATPKSGTGRTPVEVTPPTEEPLAAGADGDAPRRSLAVPLIAFAVLLLAAGGVLFGRRLKAGTSAGSRDSGPEA